MLTSQVGIEHGTLETGKGTQMARKGLHMCVLGQVCLQAGPLDVSLRAVRALMRLDASVMDPVPSNASRVRELHGAEVTLIWLLTCVQPQVLG